MNRVSLAEFEHLTTSPAYAEMILEWVGQKAVMKQSSPYSSFLSDRNL